MRITRLGLGCVLLLILTLMAAFSTANNLLFLLYGALASALILSGFVGRWNIRRVVVEPEMPDQIFVGAEFPLGLRLKNNGKWPVFSLRISGGGSLIRLGPGEQGRIERRLRFAHRGRNRVEGLFLESAFPFGLLTHRRPLEEIEGTAFPMLREVRSAAEIEIDAQASGRPILRKGLGDELYGIRDYDLSDDSRLINWKLTAKAGKPLVNEFCSPGASRITIRLESIGSGPEAERRITEAASAFRYYIDTGAEVRLTTPEGGVDYGKGLLHLEKALRVLSWLGEGKRPRPAEAEALPTPGLQDSKALRRISFVVAFLVYGSLFLIEEISPSFLGAVFPLLGLGWFLHERGGPRPPKFLWDLFSFGILLFIVFVDWRSSGVAIANTHLVMYLLINRSLSSLKTGELSQFMLICFLTFFLVSGLSISPWYFLFFLGYTTAISLWLMMGQGLPYGDFRRWRPALAGTVAGGLVLVGVLFMVTPRVERFRRMNPFVAMGIDKLQTRGSSVVGFTEKITLGFFGKLKKSTARIMRVKPAYAQIKGQTPAPIRIRGEAFDLFDGRRWGKSRVDFDYRYGDRIFGTTGGRAWAIKHEGGLMFPGGPGKTDIPYEFIFYPINMAVLFTIDGTWSVEGAPEAAYFDFTDSVHFASPYTTGVRYVVHTDPARRGFSRGIIGYDKIVAERFLSTKGSNERIAGLARDITKKAETDMKKAKAVEKYLRRYTYSTYSESEETDLTDFLFDVKSGNCEYFATAAAILLRHVGVPARLVTGFYADDWNEYGHFFDVRQGQAHAWTEAYVDGRWLTVEATPSGGLLASAGAITARLRRYFSFLQARWYRHVIGYDHYVQKNTFLRLGLQFTQDAVAKIFKYAIGGLVVLGAGFMLFAGVSWITGRAAKRASFFATAQAALERAGLKRDIHLTPREYAAVVAGMRPDLRAIASLAELHYLDVYSPAGISLKQEKEGERLTKELCALLR